MPFCSVFIVDFEKVNVSWEQKKIKAPRKKFIKDIVWNACKKENIKFSFWSYMDFIYPRVSSIHWGINLDQRNWSKYIVFHSYNQMIKVTLFIHLVYLQHENGYLQRQKLPICYAILHWPAAYFENKFNFVNWKSNFQPFRLLGKRDIMSISRIVFNTIMSWIINHWVMKLGQLMDIVNGNIFKKYFAWFNWLGSKSRGFLIYHPTAITQKSAMMSFWFLNNLKTSNKAITKSKHHLLKINISY